MATAAKWLTLYNFKHDCRRLKLPLLGTVDWSGFTVQDLEALGNPPDDSSQPYIQKDRRRCSQQQAYEDGVDQPPLGRLVDLREFSASTPDKARLINTVDIGFAEKAKEHGFYSTLSCCWGGEEFHMVKSSNLESARARLPYSNLPCTFKDAFQISKSLSVNFLRIDVLCILQGNVDD